MAGGGGGGIVRSDVPLIGNRKRKKEEKIASPSWSWTTPSSTTAKTKVLQMEGGTILLGDVSGERIDVVVLGEIVEGHDAPMAMLLLRNPARQAGGHGGVGHKTRTGST